MYLERDARPHGRSSLHGFLPCATVLISHARLFQKYGGALSRGRGARYTGCQRRPEGIPPDGRPTVHAPPDVPFTNCALPPCSRPWCAAAADGQLSERIDGAGRRQPDERILDGDFSRVGRTPRPNSPRHTTPLHGGASPPSRRRRLSPPRKRPHLAGTDGCKAAPVLLDVLAALCGTNVSEES